MPQPELAESSQATSPTDQATGAPADQAAGARAGEEVQVLGRSRARSARELLGRAPVKGLRASALVAVAVTLLNWSPWEQIKSGLDPSWQAGIALGFVRHLQWGPALDFTYGPYGFAGFLEPFYRSTALIALLYIFVITWLLAMLLIEGLRSRWGLAGAGVIAWAVVALSWPVVRAADFASVVGLGLGLALLETKSRTLRAVLTSLLGGLAGFVVLVKPNTGIVMMGLLALALAGTDVPRRERARIAWQAGGALVAVFVVAWAAAGQSFSNLLVFTRASISLIVSYSADMGGRLQPAYIAWYALALAALYALTFALTLRHRSRRYQLFASLMFVGWSWATTKEGFVNGNHFPEFFRIFIAAIALVCICVPPRSLYAGALALAACITLATTPVPSINPIRSLHALGTEVADLAQPGRFAQLTASTRAGLLRSEKLAPSALALVKGRSFAIEPWEDMIAWVDPEARWDPEPVVQSYSAYTAYLDQLDAAFLASSRAPQRMLVWRFPFGFDFRDPFADPPKTMETIYCRYVQVALSGAWQVLQRAPDRCGRAVRIGEVHARFGQSVMVPSAPGKMVLASFLFGPTLLAKLETVLLKQPDTFLTIWTGRDRPVTYRLVPGTSADEHVIAAPAALGYAARFTPQTVERLQVSGTGWRAGTGSVTIVFSAVSMSR